MGIALSSLSVCAIISLHLTNSTRLQCRTQSLAFWNSPTTLFNTVQTSESSLEALLQIMWTKMCYVCVIFSCNRLRCHYLHALPDTGLRIELSSLLTSLSLSKISFEVFWLCSTFYFFCFCHHKTAHLAISGADQIINTLLQKLV